jgi:hypothetical protein
VAQRAPDGAPGGSAQARAAAAGDPGRPVNGGGGVLGGIQPGVLDHRAAGGEPPHVASLGQDHCPGQRGHAVDAGRQVRQAELFQHQDHALLCLGEPGAQLPPVAQQQVQPLQRPRPLRRHPAGVRQRVPQALHDRVAHVLPGPPGQFAADCGQELLIPHLPQPLRLPAAPVRDHRHPRQPRHRLQRPPGRRQGRRPCAAQQVPRLLHARRHIRDQAGPARPQVPQPRPVRVRPLGQIALQPDRQLADQVRVPVIGLAERIVITLPRPVHRQRLHADEPVSRRVRQSHQRLPPVPRRLARHRQPRKTRLHCTLRAPSQQPGQLMRLCPHDLAGQHPALVIHHHRDLLVLAQVHRQHRPVPPDCLPKPLKLPVPVPVTPRQSITLSHERPPAVLGSEARHHTRRTFLQQPDQSQQVVTT